MNLGIYKAGQGYWVRVLSAIFAGSVALAGALWAWQQAATIPIPMPTWEMTVVGDSEGLAPGTSIELLGPSEDDPTTRDVYATAVIEEANATTTRERRIVVGDIDVSADRFLSASDRLATPEGSDGSRAVLLEARNLAGIRAFEPLYLQAGIAGVLMLASAVVILIFVGVKKGSVDFLIATDGEMKKVNWSTRREVIGSTWVVVAASFIIAMFLFLVNSVFSSIFGAMGVLG